MKLATTNRKPARPAMDWRPAYLRALSEVGMFAKAAACAKVDRSTVWRERRSNPEFAAGEKEAIELANMALEDEAFRRAHDGVVRYRFTKDGTPLKHPVTGEPYYELEYSDALLIKLLAARMPERYGNKVALKHSTPPVRHLTLAEFEERVRMLEAGEVAP